MQVPKLIKIRPPLTAQSNQEVAQLKAELEIELRNKKQCAYHPYECTQLTVDGSRYCVKHILQDKNAPYRQCSFNFTSNGKRCPTPAPKQDRREFVYCTEHSMMMTLARNRQTAKCTLPPTPEAVLCSLSQYVKRPRNKTHSISTDESHDKQTNDESNEQKPTTGLNPFKDIDANKLYNSICKEVLDVCSESDSDVEASTISTAWLDAQQESSDPESIDSDEEDPLKHATVYTEEEITRITRDKLIKLQSLYIEQYHHLQHVLKEKKRKYYQNMKKEKETCCNIYNQVRENPKEQRLYKKLKALSKYNKTYGTEAILSKRSHNLRTKVNFNARLLDQIITNGLPLKQHHTFTKCCHIEFGIKCTERALPLAKHCRKHILEDPNQVLFKPCGWTISDTECSTPIEGIFEDAACRLHAEMPPIRSYSQMRKCSESDMDDSFDASEDSSVLVADLDSTNDYMDIKPELTVPNELFEDRLQKKMEPKSEDPDSPEEVPEGSSSQENSDTSMKTESCEGDNKLYKYLEYNSYNNLTADDQLSVDDHITGDQQHLTAEDEIGIKAENE